MKKASISGTIVFFVVLDTVFAHAEVMDKEPSTLQHWLFAVVLGLTALAAWRWRWWVGAIATGLGILLVPTFYFELTDKFVGPAIRAEAGDAYAVHYYISTLVWLMLNVVAIYAWFAKYRRD